MPLPLRPLAILDATGTTRSIAREVLGAATPTGLVALASAAGFSLPVAMSDFEGFANNLDYLYITNESPASGSTRTDGQTFSFSVRIFESGGTAAFPVYFKIIVDNEDTGEPISLEYPDGSGNFYEDTDAAISGVTLSNYSDIKSYTMRISYPVPGTTPIGVKVEVSNNKTDYKAIEYNRQTSTRKRRIMYEATGS